MALETEGLGAAGVHRWLRFWEGDTLCPGVGYSSLVREAFSLVPLELDPPWAALTSQQRGVNVPEATLRGEATLGGIILNLLSLQLQDTHDEDLFSLLSFICSTFSLPQQCFLACFPK